MTPPTSVTLWWLPVGAGGHITAHTSRWWEAMRARIEHRPAQNLFHTALEVNVDGHRTVVEMTPAWGQPPAPRGVILTGPVGSALAGCWRLFRYEVRAWPDGILPDRDYAVESPVTVSTDSAVARGILGSISAVPPLVWGRDPLHVGDMWNSNSLISWLLVSSGIDAAALSPPAGGRAPGWRCGILAAGQRQ